MVDIVLKDTPGKNYPILEAGAYRASCYAIVMLGTTYSNYYNKNQTKILFMWELPDERITVDGQDLPRAISETYTLSLNEKASLRKMLESWRGKPFSPEELQGFSLSKVLGAPCMVSTVQAEKANGDKFAKVSAVSKLPKMMAKPEEVENPLVMFDISNADCPLSDMSKLPEWVQNRIMESNEYKERTSAEIVSTPEEYSEVEVDGDLPF